MRVAIIANPYVPVPPIKYGGTERVIYHIIKGLTEQGHQPVLFGPGDSKVDCEIVPTTESAISFPKTRSKLPEHQLLVEKIRKKTKRLLREYAKDFDILHSHEFDLLDFQFVPNVTTLHGPINFKSMQYFRKRSHLAYVAISTDQQESFPELNYAGMVYNGLDPDEFPIVEQLKDRYLCFLGRFDHEKSPHLAIELAINLGLKIKIAGKLDFLGESYFRQEVKPYLDHPSVEYLGVLGFEDKVKLVSGALCNLHPTGFREPFGLTVLEAAYCGTPTLAIARGSMPELIEEFRTGMLVEDFVEGYYQIKKCFEMDRSYIANRARMLFNYHTMTKEYSKIYDQVIEKFRAINKKS